MMGVNLGASRTFRMVPADYQSLNGGACVLIQTIAARAGLLEQPSPVLVFDTI
jgi:hypothetical protein